MMPHRQVLMALVALLVLSGLCGDGGAQEPTAPAPESKRRLSPREAAEAVRQQGDLVRRQMAPGAAAEPTSGIKKRTGVFYLVSWSIPEPELKGYLREAFKLGATVAFRGLIDDDFKKTVARTKTLALELREQAPHTTIDPVVFRQLGITTVPALVVANEQQALIVEGAAPLAHLLSVMVRENGELKPLVEWYEGTQRSWERGGPIDVQRPAMPTLVGLKHVPTTLTRYPIWERDMEIVIRERIQQADWNAIQRKLELQVKDKLKKGPGIALTAATTSRAFAVDPTVQFDKDVKREDGATVLIKAGTQVNPLTQVTLRQRFIVIDGRNPQQVAFAKQQVQQYGAAWVKVMLTAGDFEAVSKTIQGRAYWVLPEIVTRFKLEHVPSVITQHGPLLKVEEFAL
jgi:conjugal transfer pilus assembly protein TraW